MRTDGALEKCQALCGFTKVHAGFWKMLIGTDGQRLDPNKPIKPPLLEVAEWHLYHIGYDVYKISYRPSDNVIHELFKGRIYGQPFLGDLMNSFKEFDKTRAFHRKEHLKNKHEKFRKFRK